RVDSAGEGTGGSPTGFRHNAVLVLPDGLVGEGDDDGPLPLRHVKRVGGAVLNGLQSTLCDERSRDAAHVNGGEVRTALGELNSPAVLGDNREVPDLIKDEDTAVSLSRVLRGVTNGRVRGGGAELRH